MNDFRIISLIFKKVNLIFTSMFIFKLFLLFFYIIGSYQAFLITTNMIILRFIIITDVFLLFLGVLCIIVNFKNRDIKKNLFIVFLFVNIIFSMFTILLSLILLTFIN